MVQGEFWPDGIGKFAVQVKLGDFGEMSTCDAEATRRMRLDQLSAGSDPVSQQRQDLAPSHSGKPRSGIATRT